MDQSLEKEAAHPPDIEELKQIIKNRFSFDRRKMIFFTLNSCLLGLAIFSLFSSITLESNAQIFRIRQILTIKSASFPISTLTRQSCSTLETILIPQNLAQLCTIVCGIIGFFGIYQKSRKILVMYPLSLSISLVFRVVATIIVFSFYNTIHDVFNEETGTFVAIEAFFLAVNILFAAISFAQFKKAQVEYFIVSKDKERLIADNSIAYEVIKNIIKS